MPFQETQLVRDDVINGPSDAKDTKEDSEWTHVTSKSRRGRRKKPAKPQEFTIKPRTEDLVPPEELLKDYHHLRDKWAGETWIRRLRELINNHAAEMKISKAIHLGVGTFDPHHGGWDAKRSTFAQLIAFLIMVEELENITGSEIPCIFQEPMFSQSDRDFLTSLGHQVVECPEATELVDRDAVLVGFHLYRGIYDEVLERSLPAIFVGSPYHVWDEMGKTDFLANLEKLDKTYIGHKFPQEVHGAAFSGTVIYFRPAVEVTLGAPKLYTKDEENAEDELSSKLESTRLS